MTQPLTKPIQFGKYTLYERIGRGGMADVFKGRIQGPGGFERVFVVKRILPHLSDDPAFIRMFVEEAKMSARLNHPNIVQIFELGAVDDEFFISMEYVPGHDLSETMRAMWKTSGAPPPALVAYIGREMCRGLGYAHGLTDETGQLLGMIHRDVSPSNVMLSFEGAVKMLDFGIAKALGDTPEVTKSGTLKGKYAYMAPEQTEGDDVDHRIDIFAAAIVMHEVLTGRRLFKGQNDMATIERVRNCVVRPPSHLNPACPPLFDDVLLRALARNPDDRFQTAGEMADALDEIVHAAHFTPQHLAAALRETFGMDGGTGPGAVVDRKMATSLTNPSLSVSKSPVSRRSPTVPPVTLSGSRQGARLPTLAPNPADPSAVSDIAPRPMFKRASFWLVALLCAGGIGVAVSRGVSSDPKGLGDRRGGTLGAVGAAPSANRASGPPTRKSRNIPVLIQSDPEGADIYVAGKLESLGTTPKWVTMEIDPEAPARVMVRKAGFQDKAFAVESEKPPLVRLIPIALPGASVEPTTPSGQGAGAARPARSRMVVKKLKAADDNVNALNPAAAPAPAGAPPPEIQGELQSE